MENFLGEIRLFPYTRIPSGWWRCEGQTMAISQYTALFSVIGTEFGGDGTTNFQLPELRGRTIIGAGNHQGVVYANGNAGGAEAVTLTEAQLGAHRHDVMALDVDADQYVAAGYVLAKTQAPLYGDNVGAVTISPSTVEASGGGLPHGNIQPEAVCIYCIAVEGIYPSWQ